MSSSDTTESTPGPPAGAKRPSTWQPVLLVAGAVVSLLLVAVGALGLAGLFGGTPAPKTTLPASPEDGTRLGAFRPALPRVGGTGALGAPWTQGHPTIVLFFARWCAPCTREVPKLAAALGDGRLADGVDVIGVDEDLPGVAARFVRADGVRFPVGVDHEGSFVARLAPAGLPSAVYVGADARIAGVSYGELSPAQLFTRAAALGRSTAARRLPSRQ